MVEHIVLSRKSYPLAGFYIFLILAIYLLCFTSICFIVTYDKCVSFFKMEEWEKYFVYLRRIERGFEFEYGFLYKYFFDLNVLTPILVL